MSVQDQMQTGLNHKLNEMVVTLDEQGKRAWREREPQLREGARRAGYIAAIVVNLVMLYIVNNVLAWDLSFITAEFTEALGVINVSIGAAILANLVFVSYDPRWFRHLAQIGLSLLSVRVLYTLFIVFPFDLGAGIWDMWLRLALVVCIVGAAIGILVETIQLLVGRFND